MRHQNPIRIAHAAALATCLLMAPSPTGGSAPEPSLEEETRLATGPYMDPNGLSLAAGPQVGTARQASA